MSLQEKGTNDQTLEVLQRIKLYKIYRKHHSHLVTTLWNIVVGAFLFGMRSCE